MSIGLGDARAHARQSLAELTLPVVRSEPVDLVGALLHRLPTPRGVLAWVRDGEGLIGWGEAARLEVSGPDRFAVAQRWWRELVAGLTVQDGVGARGCGPVLFGSFAFTADEPSVLVLPEVVLGRRDGVTWLTTAGQPPRLSSPAPVQAPGDVSYAEGELPVTGFREAVVRAAELIRRGELAKVVLAHDLVAVAEAEIDPRFLLTGLAEGNPGCWAFAVDDLVGATPELLVGLDNGVIRSRVLAGTVPRGGDEAEDAVRTDAMMHTLKYLDEHRFAVESHVDALRPHVRTLDEPAGPHALELPNVIHLATDVTAVASDATDVLDLVAALHPTAAVGGTPTDVALELLPSLEPMSRGRYAGPVGWIDAAGDGEWGIALRCAQLSGRSARLFAGCGIVADSDPDVEVAEAQAKFVPVRDALEGSVT